MGLFLGVTATFYTLLLGLSALTVTVMAIVLTLSRRRLEPLLRLAVIAVVAGLIALITWLPFLLRALRDPLSGTGSAQHYLPADGAVLTFPMLQFSLLGALCMLGTLWLIVRARSSVRAGALALGVLTVYLWSLLSMLTTLGGTTLLSFRLQPTLTTLLAAAGAFGFIEVTQAAAARWSRTLIPVAAVIGLTGGMAFSQDIPDVLRPDLTIAYTDTDGHGQRGDRRPPGAEKYYAEIDRAIQAATGRPRNETVVLTADYSFLSYYPYLGFQGLTSHYANPLAQFDKRAAAIESWADVKTADAFAKKLDELPWEPPAVFLMRRGANDSYTLRLAEDVYPNQPNVRRYTVDLDAALFAGPHFTVKTSVRSCSPSGSDRDGRRDPTTNTAGLLTSSCLGGFVTPLPTPAGLLTSSCLGGFVTPLPSSSVTDPAAQKYRIARIVAVVAGLLGALLAIATPFLPVKQTTAQLNWPQNGVLDSVTAPLIGYVATDLSISVPCQAAAGLVGPQNTDRSVLLSTVPRQAPKAVDRGLLIERVNNNLAVVVRNTPVLVAPLSAVLSPDCERLTFTARADKVTAEFVGLTQAQGTDPTPDDPTAPLKGERSGYDFRPQIIGVFTDLSGPAPPGLTLSATIDTRYSSAPTLLKLIAMILGVALTVAALIALHVLDTADGVRHRRFLPGRWWSMSWLDGLVAAALVWWHFVGANTSDDGYILTMARVSEHAGYMANYYRWFGTPEAPFGWYYDLLALWAHVSTTSVWMRLPDPADGTGLLVGDQPRGDPAPRRRRQTQHAPPRGPRRACSWRSGCR